MLLVGRTALEEERNKTAKQSEQLASERASNELYVQQLESEKLRSVQLKDKSSNMVEVSHSRALPARLVPPTSLAASFVHTAYGRSDGYETFSQCCF